MPAQKLKLSPEMQVAVARTAQEGEGRRMVDRALWSLDQLSLRQVAICKQLAQGLAMFEGGDVQLTTLETDPLTGRITAVAYRTRLQNKRIALNRQEPMPAAPPAAAETTEAASEPATIFASE